MNKKIKHLKLGFNAWKIAGLFAIALFLQTPAIADLNDGLVAYYPFNGNMLDESGHGYNGTIPTYCGSPTLTVDRFGIPSSSYSFNNDCISLGTLLNLPAWNANAVSAWFLSDGGGDFGRGYGQNIIDKTIPWSDYWISLYTDRLQFIAGLLPNGGTEHVHDYRDNQWHHVVANKSGTHAELWVDGILRGSYNNAQPTINNAPLLIGFSNSSDGYKRKYWSGKLDDFRLYNRALTSEEIVALFNDNPSVPPPLHATAVSPTGIRLTWDDNSSSEMGFRIQSKEGDCTSTNPWTTRADLRPDNVGDKATFLDTNLLAATPYAYQVSTYYGANNFSAYSECAFASTGAAGIPHIPAGQEAYSRSNIRVDLFWNDASNDETEFTIYRQVGSGSWTLLNTVADNTQSYSDTTATGNDTTTSYHYDVRACNSSGCSVPLTSSPAVPFRPGNLAATVASTVKLTWEDKSSNESGFEIQRKNGICTSENPWVVAQKVAANTKAYNDKRAVPATVYSYRVRANYNTGIIPGGFGYSRFTGCVSVTAP